MRRVSITAVVMLLLLLLLSPSLIWLFSVTGQFKNIKEVQNDLMGFINADTILVGHGLENDLRALKLIHATILDTAVVFPHYHGLPFRRSLRSLVSSYLKRDIQVNSHEQY